MSAVNMTRMKDQIRYRLDKGEGVNVQTILLFLVHIISDEQIKELIDYAADYNRRLKENQPKEQKPLADFTLELEQLCLKHNVRIEDRTDYDYDPESNEYTHVEHMIAIVDVEYGFSHKFQEVITLPIGNTSDETE